MIKSVNSCLINYPKKRFLKLASAVGLVQRLPILTL